MNILAIGKAVKRRNLIESSIIVYCEARKRSGKAFDEYILNDMREDLHHFNNKVENAIATYIDNMHQKNELKKYGVVTKKKEKKNA